MDLKKSLNPKTYMTLRPPHPKHETPSTIILKLKTTISEPGDIIP